MLFSELTCTVKQGWGEEMEEKCGHHPSIDFQSTPPPVTDVEVQICLAG